MLNYILHYPFVRSLPTFRLLADADRSLRNENKFISLFPSSGKVKIPAEGNEADLEGMEKTERTRLGMLMEVRGMMQRGEISLTPEDGGNAGEMGNVVIGRKEDATSNGKAERTGKKGTHGLPGTTSKPTVPAYVEEEDEFFESD